MKNMLKRTYTLSYLRHLKFQEPSQIFTTKYIQANFLSFLVSCFFILLFHSFIPSLIFTTLLIPRFHKNPRLLTLALPVLAFGLDTIFRILHNEHNRLGFVETRTSREK